MTVTQEVRPARYPVAPTPEPIKGTLLDIISADNDVDWLDGEGLFPSFNCLTTGVRMAETCGPVAVSKFTGVESPAWQDGLRFAAYGVATCKLEDPQVIKDGVDRAFLAAQSRVVEEALMESVFAANLAANPALPGSWPAATDLTPGGPTGAALLPEAGIGLLESHMARNYAGQGIIHIPRIVATLASAKGALKLDGNVLYTELRTPVAAGAGYDYPNLGPDGSAAPEGEKWIYATGWVVLSEKHHNVREVHGLNDTTAVGLEPNDIAALAERGYLVAVDCYKAAVRVAVYPDPTP